MFVCLVTTISLFVFLFYLILCKECRVIDSFEGLTKMVRLVSGPSFFVGHGHGSCLPTQ